MNIVIIRHPLETQHAKHHSKQRDSALIFFFPGINHSFLHLLRKIHLHGPEFSNDAINLPYLLTSRHVELMLHEVTIEPVYAIALQKSLEP